MVHFDALSQKIFAAQNECTLSWITQDGSPAATVVSFFFDDDCLWMTALAGSARDIAISRDGRVAVVVSGKGSKAGDTRCVSMRGRCEVLRDEKTRVWFFPKFSKKVLYKSRIGAKLMASSMNNASNVVLKFTPDKVIPYDAQKMMKLANFMI
jgi:hypothetical protein